MTEETQEIHHRHETTDIFGQIMAHIAKEDAALPAVEKRMTDIEQDLRPIKKVYHAIMGAITVGGVLIGVLIFIYQSDRTEMKLMSDALYKQGNAIERLLTIQTIQSTALEKHIDKDDRIHERGR